MLKRVFVFFCCFLSFSFTPPLNILRITSFFGESRRDHFHNGIDIASSGEEVRAVMPGTVIFYYDEEDYPYENPLGYGNFVILQHGTRYRSHYYHLEKGSIKKNLVAVSEGTVIGRSGNSGHSSGPHLHFTMIDLIERKIINPLRFFTDFKDFKEPVVAEIWFSTNEGRKERISSSSLTSLKGKRLKIFVEAWDKVQTTGLKLGLYKVELIKDGESILSFVFDSLDIVPKRGTLLNSKYGFEDVFEGDYLYCLGQMPLKDCYSNIIVRIADFSGNYKNYPFFVK